MKTWIFILLTISFESALAENYICKTPGGKIAELIVNSNEIHWHEQTTSASSAGKYSGIESAPFSELKGYSLFHLYEYYTTNNSRFILAISPQLQKSQISGKVIIYFDDDDHISELESYICNLNQIRQ